MENNKEEHNVNVKRDDYPMWSPYFYNVVSFHLNVNQNKEQNMTEIVKTNKFSVFNGKVVLENVGDE